MEAWFSNTWALLGMTPWEFTGVLACMTLAYIIFGIAGFGTALVAGPVLAHFMPLATIVPMLALLDCFASAANVFGNARQASRPELRRLLPMMVVGSLAGAAILLTVRPDMLLLLLGVFAVAYACYALAGGMRGRRFRERSAYPFGLVGGVFSALFGSGGFIYAIYLAGRVDSGAAFRTTQSTLIGCATFTRMLLFLAAGLYADGRLLAMAAMLVPAMVVGIGIGHALTARLDRDRFMRVVYLLVLGAGVALVLRWWTA